MKNIQCQKVFKESTSNNTKLSKTFDEENDLDIATEKFMKKLQKLLFKCFKKIGKRKDTQNEHQEKLYNKWKILKTKSDPISKAEMNEVEEELVSEYFDKVVKASEDIDCDEGGKNSGKLWNIRKQLCPRSRDPPTAMKAADGSLVTNVEQIKDMAINAYKERLQNRPIKEALKKSRRPKKCYA